VTSETEWVAAHVFHQGDLDALVVQAVGPVVDDLVTAGLVDDWFFLRHWEGGLHVRLRVRCVTPAAAPAVRERVTARCGGYLAAHPSEHTLSQDEYAESAAKLARLEGADDHVAELGPPDGLTFPPYRRDLAGYDIGPASEQLERHFTESSRLAMGMLRSRPEPGLRDTTAFAQLLLAWFVAQPRLAALGPLVAGDAAPPDPPRGSPGLWRAAVDRRFHAQRDRLAGIATRMHALATAPPAPGGGHFPDWVASLERLAAAVGPAGPAGSTGLFALLNRCAHLACNRLGVSLTEEGYLRVLAARTVRTLTGVAG
jgi:hypothetical protein